MASDVAALRDQIKELESSGEQHQKLTISLQCDIDNLKRKLQRAERDIEDVESLNKSLMIDQNKSKNIIAKKQRVLQELKEQFAVKERRWKEREKHIQDIECLNKQLTIAKSEAENMIGIKERELDQKTNKLENIKIRMNRNQEKQSEGNEAKLSRLKETVKTLRTKNEQYRFAALALKRISVNLPDARINTVKWQKGNVSDHMTTRSLALHRHRQSIMTLPKYFGSYVVENNPSHKECVNSPHQLEAIKTFVDRNDVGNVNPEIDTNNRSTIKKLDKVLGTRIITRCDHLPILVGQTETFAKVDVQSGVILCQYVGNEMTKEEYHAVYNGTKQEMDHLTFMHGATLKRSAARNIDIYIDGYGACKSSVFLFINDGRTNIRGEETTSDSNRINTEYVTCLVNGWPMILIRTTKSIAAGDTLWINYGPNYGLVLDEKAFLFDQRLKTMRSVEQILKGIDLKEQEPLDISSEDESRNTNQDNDSLDDDNSDIEASTEYETDDEEYDDDSETELNETVETLKRDFAAKENEWKLKEASLQTALRESTKSMKKANRLYATQKEINKGLKRKLEKAKSALSLKRSRLENPHEDLKECFLGPCGVPCRIRVYQPKKELVPYLVFLDKKCGELVWNETIPDSPRPWIFYRFPGAVHLPKLPNNVRRRYEKKAISSCWAYQLKDICRANNLRVGGCKEELRERVTEHIHCSWEDLCKHRNA